MNPAMGTAAGAGSIVDPADITRAEPDQGPCVLTQGCEYQFADFTGFQHLAGVNVHSFHQYVILRDMQSILCLAHSRAGAEDVRQAVEVIDFSAPQIFNGLSRRFNGSAQFTGHNDLLDIQVLLGINAALQGLLTQLPGIGRAGPYHGRLIGLQHKQQPFAGQCAAPDAQCAKVLGADNVRAADIQREVQGMDIPVIGPHSHLPEPAAFRFLELVKVLLCEGAHGGHAGGAGGCGNKHHVFFRNSRQFAQERPDALGIALRLFVNKREFLYILQCLDVRRFNTGFIKRPLIVRCVIIGELNNLLQVFQLPFFQFLSRKGFQFLIPVLVVNIPAHVDLLLIILHICSF